MDYTRTRNGSTLDAWAGNTTGDTNLYTKIERNPSADWVPAYDEKGQLTQDDTAGGATKGYIYHYDAWDRLVSVKNTSNATVEEFRYNGLGHRIGWLYDENASGTISGADDWFYFQYNERWQQVGMWRAGDTDPTEVFVYLGAGADGYGTSSYIDQCVYRERDTNADGDVDERYYYLQNWRHDVVVIMTALGAIKEKIIYDAYGPTASSWNRPNSS